MKKFYSLLALVLLAACSNNKKTAPEVLTPSILATQFFSVDAGRDTLIQTLHGSIIKIPAGGFSVNGKVRIEIKEAFSPLEMFAAGLTTESGGRLLRSAGMIYINGTAGGEKIELVKPIQVSVPNQYYDSAMQIFKGIENSSGRVDWTDPQPMDTTPQSLQWRNGATIFNTLCRSCHMLFSDGTGPAMAGLESRGPWRDRKNIYDFIRDPARFMAKDRYTQLLKDKFGSIMPAYPLISDKGLAELLNYIKNEEKRPGAKEEERYAKTVDKTNTYPSVETLKSDSGYYLPYTIYNTKPSKGDTIYLPAPKLNQSFFENSNEDENEDQPVFVTEDTAVKPAKAEEMEGLRDGFTDLNSTSGMYDFEIKTFGWYNVDAFVEGYAGTNYVKVSAQLQFEFNIDMHVYLFVPDRKMLSVSYVHENNIYSFDKINGTIPLYLKDRAILFAFGSQGNKMYYGIKEFTVMGEQTILIKIKETNSVEILKMIRANQMEGIDLGIEEKGNENNKPSM